MLTFTSRAIDQARLHKAMHPDTQKKGLRIWISDKNCDGFMYGVTFDDPIESDQQLEIEGQLVLLDPGTCLLYTSPSPRD